MIAFVGVSAITLSMLQASVVAPTEAFRGCLREATTKATSEKVTGDKIEDYLKGACTGQMDALTNAIVAFRMKNGMSKKQAVSDAAMTVDDYISTPADNYKFTINYNAASAAPAAAPAAAAPAAQPAATTKPADTSSQPHNP